MLWADEVEGAVQHKARVEAVEASVAECSEVRTATGGELRKLWAELAAQRKLLADGLAEQGRVMTQLLAQQHQLMAAPTSTGRARPNAPRSRLEDIICYRCRQKGNFQRDCRVAPASVVSSYGEARGEEAGGQSRAGGLVS